MRAVFCLVVMLTACAAPRAHDVQTDTGELCAHFSDEDGYNADRQAVIDQQAALYCGQ